MQQSKVDTLVLTPELKSYLEKEGYFNIEVVPGRGICGIREFLFTYGICFGLDEFGFEGRWCFPKEHAKVAFLSYQIWSESPGGDPIGPWVKYKGRDGERTNPSQPI